MTRGAFSLRRPAWDARRRLAWDARRRPAWDARRRLAAAHAAAAVLAIALAGTVPSSAAVAATGRAQPYGHHDFGGFRNVLPPGASGFDNLRELLAFKAAGAYPPHTGDQLAMYSGLTTAAPNITSSQLGRYYKDATFGVPAGEVASTESPEPGVTIVRDRRYGVPHIYGETRAALEFGIGYATAEDRLFFIDALRHAGRGELGEFAGGANVAMDEAVWSNEPYTEQDLADQVEWVRTHAPHGERIFADAVHYIAGINAYIAKARSNPLALEAMLPAEYDAIGEPQGPRPFTLDDLVAIATLVGGIFGNGGGQQLANAVLYQALTRRFGPEHVNVPGSPERVAEPGRRRAGASGAAGASPDRSGFATFLSFDDPADPEAPSTVRGRSFPYQTLPQPSPEVQQTIALPDPGSVRYVNHLAAGAVPGSEAAGIEPDVAGAAGDRPVAPGLEAMASAGPGLLAFPSSDSNALLVSARDSASGHPLAVMGPQVAYFSPEILIEEDIHGPGIDADGAAFPGANLYVQLGHGRDYAWSATSAGQNIIDTFAVPLCKPGGGKPTPDSDYYLLHGHCTAMETLTRRESWSPNPADQTPAGSATFRTERTADGLVIARARIGGRSVAYTNLRSTYDHELDSVSGFYLLNDPAAIRNPRDFTSAAARIDYTFNWFYADDRHIAYFNSGLNPVRGTHTDPLFPSWAADVWAGYHGAALTTPASLRARATPPRAHPQTIDQSYLTSWNNKQAPGYDDAATGQQFASVYRSQLLDENIEHFLRVRRGKLRLADLVDAMGNAGTQDLRGVEVLPYALQMIGRPRGGAVSTAVSELRRWVATGAHRINRGHPGASGNYEQSDAVRIMDAWWPRLVTAEFQPALGAGLWRLLKSDFPVNDEPGHGTSGAHLGSAFDVGFYGIVQKDLRAVLHRRVSGPLNRPYCGGGSASRCRAALLASLRAAVRESARQVYPGGGLCAAGDQMCADSIQFRALGAITQPPIEWVNRPTFQQADEILGHGPR